MPLVSIPVPWQRADCPERFDGFVTTVVALCLAAIWVIFALVAYQTYQSQWRLADLSVNNIAALLEHDIALNFEVCDRALLSMRAQLSAPGIQTLPDGIRQRILLEQATNTAAIGFESVAGADGLVVMDTGAQPKTGASVADRPYFLVHRDGSFGDGLFVSEPFQSDLDHGGWRVVLSRRITNAGGRFGGAVLLSIGLGYFQSLFEKVHLPPGSVLNLAGAGDRVMARSPFDPSFIGRKVTFSDRYLPGATASGDFVYRSRFDGIRRLYTFRKIGALPLTQIAGFSETRVYEDWIEEIALIGSVFFVLSGCLVALHVALRRELRRRTEAEAALKITAGTDFLTGLANRRRFDEALEVEWRRGLRMKTPLSLILIDCDFFKAYNDYYGHVEGDRTLILVADAIKASTSRSGDLAARIGGEEFAVLLPATAAGGAAAVAERIRCAVLQREMPHALSPKGQLSVSAGLTCKRPAPGETPTAVMREADLALYEAKAMGRNVVKVFEPAKTGTAARDRSDIKVTVS